MAAMQSFTVWFLQELPEFLMAEPICYLWGLLLLGYIVRLILSIR